MSSGEVLNIKLRRAFASDQKLPFLLNVAFNADAGFTILFGASGAGKTTLLDCVAGLQTPDAGQIAIGETLLFDSEKGVNLPANRRGIGYLLQSLALFPHLSVRQNVQYGLHGLTKNERDRRSNAILESFRIAGLADRRPGELSGGERQRAALARTLVRRPRALLLDEPLTALDAATKSQILADLRAWHRENGIPVLFVTHQREEAFALGEHVIAFEDGRIIAEGSPHQVLHRPKLESVAQLSGFENILDATFVAAHPEQGTMTCRIGESAPLLEVPLTRIEEARPLRIGIRAGDILLASEPPRGVSARNVFPGTILGLERRDVMVIAKVNCGVTFEVHLTPGARDSLDLDRNRKVWLVLKTYSCQVLQSEK